MSSKAIKFQRFIDKIDGSGRNKNAWGGGTIKVKKWEIPVNKELAPTGKECYNFFQGCGVGKSFPLRFLTVQ